MNYLDLLEEAKKASAMAYAPYSQFPVGAALLTASGEVFTGCNVENASYGLTICAERVAVTKAVSAGFREFKAIAVFAPTGEPVSPCGACRQVLAEFSPDGEVIMGNGKGDYVVAKVAELLPGAFSLKTDKNSR
ncbi:MAG: cytidine deaminase [Clostridia bacterium]|jgi:cytidine deaminase|nr:cytidine deaminase [Clostridia bacterium]